MARILVSLSMLLLWNTAQATDQAAVFVCGFAEDEKGSYLAVLGNSMEPVPLADGEPTILFALTGYAPGERVGAFCIQGTGGHRQKLTFTAKTFTGSEFPDVTDDCVIEGPGVKPDKVFSKDVIPGDLFQFASPSLYEQGKTMQILAYYPTVTDLKQPSRTAAEFCKKLIPKKK